MKSLPAFLATAALSVAVLTASLPALSQDRITVATLNGETVYLDEIIAVAETLPAEYQQQGIAALYPQLVDEVVNSRLAAVAGKESGIDQDEVVAEAIRTAANRVIGEAYITRKVSEQLTDEAIQTAYDAYVDDTASREQVTASHILVETEDEARAIIAQLNDGAEFAELAKEKSTGPSGPNGGELGSFGRGQMVPAFETAAFSMPAGSYSETPVQTQFGWHVLKVYDKGIEAAPSLDEMRDQIVANLSRQSFSRIVEELRVGSSLDIRPLEEVMAEARQSAAAAQ